MGWPAVILTVASAAMQAANTAAAGKAEQAAARARQQALNHQAAQARQNAGQERASSQRAAIAERKQGELIASRALALAAASGADTSGATMENLLGDIGAEGEFRALASLFEGEERALNLETQAALKVFEGNQERIAGDVARSMANRQATMRVFQGVGKAFGSGAFDKAPSSSLNNTTMGLGTYSNPTSSVYTDWL